MNVAELEQTFAENKTAILGVAAAGVVGLALFARKKNGVGDVGGGSGSGGSPTGTPNYSAGGQTVGGTAYDSSASDVYGAIQPQLEALGTQLSDLRNSNVVPVATPAGYYAGGANYYKSFGDGTVDALTMEEYLAQGAPQLTQVTKDDPFWTRNKLVGDGSLAYRATPPAAGYYAAGANYYRSNGDGTATPLSMEQYVGAGSPELNQVGRDSSFVRDVQLTTGGAPVFR